MAKTAAKRPMLPPYVGRHWSYDAKNTARASRGLGSGARRVEQQANALKRAAGRKKGG